VPTARVVVPTLNVAPDNYCTLILLPVINVDPLYSLGLWFYSV